MVKIPLKKNEKGLNKNYTTTSNSEFSITDHEPVEGLKARKLKPKSRSRNKERSGGKLERILNKQ